MEISNTVPDYTLKHKKGYQLSKDQNEVVDALLHNQYYFNCSQTGFGKTLTTVTAAIHAMVNNPELDIHFVILLPKSAEKAFIDTIKKDLGLPLNIYTADRTRAEKGSRFHIFNYSTLGRGLFDSKGRITKLDPYTEKLIELRKKHENLWLIADEAHALQDPKTNQYKVAQQIRDIFIGVWFLTATPILNDLEGLYHMVDLVRPNYFKNIYAFRNRFTIQKDVTFYQYDRTQRRKVLVTKKGFAGYKNMDELKAMFANISIIKSRHYDLDFIYREVEMDEDFKEFYLRAGKGIFSGTKGKQTKKQDHHAARLHDLQRVVSNSHPTFKVLDGMPYVTSKEKLLLNTIKEVTERGEASLIYFTYLETLDKIKRLLNETKDITGVKNIYEVSGNISQAERRMVESAINAGDVVLITSAGTESINLQRANNIIFYEIPFPIREFIQAVGRIARFNTEFDVMRVYVLEMNGTIDTYKKERIIAYTPMIKSVIGSSSTLPTELLEISFADVEDAKKEYLWWSGWFHI